MTLMKMPFLIAILFCFYHCSRGIQQETQKRIVSHKTFIRKMSFSGLIREKIYCEKCQLNKYQIVVDLKEMIPKDVSLDNQTFQPYYFFDTSNGLIISVVKDLYEVSQKGEAVKKQPNSDFLIIKNQKYKLINNEKYKWMPNQ